ncbi:MAG: thioredoxin fold domain-containing protein [bacterium]|nr:thioredoxin fold domain-containing protein [bacterium]
MMFQFKLPPISSRAAILLVSLFWLAVPLQSSGSDDIVEDPFAAPTVDVRLELMADRAVAGATVPVAVIYSVPEDTHMTETFFFVEFSSDPPLVFSEPVYAEPVVWHDQNVFKGEVPAWTTVTLPDDDVTITVSAEFQICAEGETEMCFPPDGTTVSLTLSPVEAGTDWQLQPVAGVSLSALEASSTPGTVAGMSEEAPTDLAGRLQNALAKGSWFAFLMVFLGGVLASLTPCVYPVIPMTIAFIGGSAKGNPLKGFILSLWFVLGIAITYSILGLLAAATGGAFGQATQNVWVNGGIAVVIGAMALSMAGFFDIQLPSALTSKVGGAKTGFLGPILMGFATGLIAAPCVGPVLIVLLTWVATTGSMFLGFWLLFTFALGMGLLFIILGTFSGALTALPNAGAWMDHVKHFFAIVLFGLALWFLRSVLPSWLLTMTFGLIMVMGLGAWGAFAPLPEGATHKQGLVKSLLLLLWILGCILALSGGLRGFAPDLLPQGGGQNTADNTLHEPDWIWDDMEGFTMAAENSTPIMMDFWAEWCTACNELDHLTYNQSEILELASEFTCIKMDMTEKNDENSAILQNYSVRGMPTVIFFDSEGNEISRFFGFKSAEEVGEIMRNVLGR